MTSHIQPPPASCSARGSAISQQVSPLFVPAPAHRSRRRRRSPRSQRAAPVSPASLVLICSVGFVCCRSVLLPPPCLLLVSLRPGALACASSKSSFRWRTRISCRRRRCGEWSAAQPPAAHIGCAPPAAAVHVARAAGWDCWQRRAASFITRAGMWRARLRELTFPFRSLLFCLCPVALLLLRPFASALCWCPGSLPPPFCSSRSRRWSSACWS